MNIAMLRPMRRGIRHIFGRLDVRDHRRQRLRGLVHGGLANLASRIVGVFVSFLSVPLTIHYLGPERYGAWVTLGSIIAWLQLVDFGLGNGLTNALTTAAGEEQPDVVRMHVSNGLLLLSSISILAGLAAGAAWPFIDWNALLGVHGAVAHAEVGPAVAVAICIFLLQFPLSITGKIYLAYQEGRIGAWWGMAGNLLSLIGLLTVTRTQGGLVWLVLAISGSYLLVNLGAAIWLFRWHRPTLAPRFGAIDLRAIRPLGRVGGEFFVLQLMALVTFQTDNLVIAHFLGAAQVPRYSVTYSLFNYASLPQSLLFAYLWAAYTEAIARRDIAWVRLAFRLNLALGLGFTALALGALAIIAQPFIAWWAGDAAVPSRALVGWMLAWGLINAFTNPIACLLAAASHLRAQIVYSALATLCNIGLSIFLVRRWGVEGAIAATVMAYAVFVCGPVYVDSRLLLQRLHRAV